MSVTNKVSVYIFAIVFILTTVFVLHTVFSKVSTFEVLESSQIQIIKNIYKEFPGYVYGIIDEQYHDHLDDENFAAALKEGDIEFFEKFAEAYDGHFSAAAEHVDVDLKIMDRNGVTLYSFNNTPAAPDEAAAAPMINQAIAKHEVQKGFKINENGLSHCVVYPVLENDDLIGVVQFDVDIDLLAIQINNITDIKTSLMIKSDKVKSVQNYPLYNRDRDEYMVFNNDPEIFAHIMQESPIKKYYAFDNKYYTTIEGFQLLDFQGGVLGEFLFVSDRTELMLWIFRYIRNVTILFFLSLVLIYYIVKLKIKPMVGTVEGHYLEANRELEKINRELELRVEKEIEKNRQSEELLRSRNKLADMTRMINALAHHWRQPLNALGLYVQDVSECVKAKTCSDEYMDEFRDNSMKMITGLSSTIDDFRLFFRNDTNEETSFEIVEKIINVLRLMKSQLTNNMINISVVCICGDNTYRSGDELSLPACRCAEFRIKGFKTEFKQVVLSIINNAIDAIIDNRQAGNISYGNISFKIFGENGMVKLTITDNGGGVPEKFAENIFDPYFSSKQEGKGAGLGLYNAKVILEQQFQGSISFSNTKNGASFTISIPAA